MESTVDLCKVPAGPPPADETTNFVNPTSLAPVLMAISGIMIAWSSLFTAARFYVNFRRLGWADYLNLAALACAIVNLGIQTTQLRVARHIWDVPACYFDAQHVQSIFISAVFLQIGGFFAKASILFLYYQLFTVKASMRIALWVGQILNFLLYAPGIAVAIYYETPRSYETWDNVLDGRMVTPLRWWQAQSALSVALDLYIFALPLPSVMRLMLPIRRRVELGAVFSLALLGIGASVASFVQRIEIKDTNDATWINAILYLCSFVELTVAVIVCSAPAFSSFARSHLAELPAVKRLLSTFSSRNSSVKSKQTLEGTPKGVGSGHHKSHRDTRGERWRDGDVEDEAILGPTGQYYQLKDAPTIKSWTSVDRGGEGPVVPAEFVDTGITRVVGFEQAVQKSSR